MLKSIVLFHSAAADSDPDCLWFADRLTAERDSQQSSSFRSSHQRDFPSSRCRPRSRIPLIFIALRRSAFHNRAARSAAHLHIRDLHSSRRRPRFRISHLSQSTCGGALFSTEQLVSQLTFTNVTFIHPAAVPDLRSLTCLDRVAAERAS